VSSQRAAWLWRGPIASQANVKIGNPLGPPIAAAELPRSVMQAAAKMGKVPRRPGQV
jgi:hypothetical protein